MAFAGMNYLAVVVAGVAGYAFGAIYYMSLSTQWLAALGKTTAEIKTIGGKGVFGIAAIAQLVLAFMLAGLMAHLGAEAMSAAGGLITGFFVWVGFVLTVLVVNYGFQGSKPMLIVIDGLHWLGVLLIQGVVIGLMGV